MRQLEKLIIITTISIALGFGFLHLLIPDIMFDRLHIFLFNLCAGGSLILFYTSNQKIFSVWTWVFYGIALCFAMSAFFEYYMISILCALSLSICVERIRIQQFSLFPWGFFKQTEPVWQKFHQASLLCLSLGLCFSILAMINQAYCPFFDSPKFQLNTFFLGFSFPLSLITFSLMFRLMPHHEISWLHWAKEAIFWAINGGVIIFFVFILLGSYQGEFLISMLLLIAIISTLIIQLIYAAPGQQKWVFVSGLCFLLATALTGLLYIIDYFFPHLIHEKLTLELHTIFSLYGWNLSGLIMICRFNDFPLHLKTKYFVLMHWIVIAVLSPFAYHYSLIALITWLSFIAFLWIVLFTNNELTSSHGGL